MRDTTDSRDRTGIQHLRGTRFKGRLMTLSLVAIAAVGIAGRGAGQVNDSLLALLPGVDDQRLADAAEIWSDPPPRAAAEAAAKLLWALSRIDPAVLDKLAAPDEREPNEPEPSEPDSTEPAAEEPAAEEPVEQEGSPTEQLRVVRVRGTVERYDAVRIPAELAEVLEFERLYRVVVQIDPSAVASGLPASVGVVARQLPVAWLSAAARGSGGAAEETLPGTGQAVEFTAVAVGSGATARLYANRLRWLPAADGTGGGTGGGSLPVGWRMLAAEGVDVGRLAEVAGRNRQSLGAEDSETFYGMLAAAAAVGRSADGVGRSADGVGQRPAPVRIETMRMLREPAALVGRWVRLDVETARLSRVAVTSPELRAKLGREAYWQIDAFGELSGAKVQLESPEEGGEPLVFENRFPISFAILDLPEWLAERISAEEGGGEVAVSMLSEAVTVDGFFFRLWSYDSEFAESRGARQIGPLVVAAEMHRRPPNLGMQRGVAAIGWMLAAVVIGSMLIAAVALWFVGRQDRAAARARRESAAKLPPSPT